MSWPAGVRSRGRLVARAAGSCASLSFSLSQRGLCLRALASPTHHPRTAAPASLQQQALGSLSPSSGARVATIQTSSRRLSSTSSSSSRASFSLSASGGSVIDPVVTPAWLSEKLSDTANSASVKVLDATWYLPNKKRDGKDDFRKARIPGAQYFDIDAIADKSSALKHMLPPAHAFSAAMDKLRISNEDTVVIYETNGIAFAAARAWWMFKCFGHADVRVLNGGLPAWKKEGVGLLELDESTVNEDSLEAAGRASVAAQEENNTPSGFQYKAALREHLVVSKKDILEDLSRGKEERKMFLLDARGEARFKGTEPEARPGLRSGHIPGSFSMSFGSLLESGTMKSKEALAENTLFKDSLQVGKGQQQAITATCGSGVTACVIALAFARFGQEVSVYDGSWSEWGADAACPLESE